MPNYRRSMFRVLFGVAVLLLVAWLGMKLLSYRGNTEALINDVQAWLNKLGPKAQAFIKPIRDFVEPKVDEWMQSAQKLVNGGQ